MARRGFLALLTGAALSLQAGAAPRGGAKKAKGKENDNDKEKEKEKESGSGDDQETAAVTSSLEIGDLAGSQFWPEALTSLITYSLSLTPRGLGYRFGSSEPEDGGMDCSGTLYHVLRHEGLKKVPRQSDQIFTWVKEAGLLNEVSGTPDQDDPILGLMRPGDLLFWTGTYDTGSRKVPISHVMMYLGRTTEGKPVMFGASNGRPYEGRRQNGVSVFDFRMPRAEGKARFVGYGPIPGLDVSGVAPQPPVRGRSGDYGKPGSQEKSSGSGARKKTDSGPSSESSGKKTDQSEDDGQKEAEGPNRGEGDGGNGSGKTGDRKSDGESREKIPDTAGRSGSGSRKTSGRGKNSRSSSSRRKRSRSKS